MKPTYEELEQKLEESRREFRAADATIHNLELRITDMAVQLAKAESKCRELAAENAEMRSSIDATIGWQESTDPENGESVRMLVDIKTQATDSFLDEVRASGVDALVERRLTASRLAKEAGHEITARDLEDEAIRARFFSVEIRKGVQS